MNKRYRMAGDSSMSPVQVVYNPCAFSKKVQAGDFVCGKSSSASAGIFIEEGSTNYVARSKELPRAQGATRGDLGGGALDSGLIRTRNASGNKQRYSNTVELLSRSSSWTSW